MNGATAGSSLTLPRFTILDMILLTDKVGAFAWLTSSMQEFDQMPSLNTPILVNLTILSKLADPHKVSLRSLES